MQKIRAVFGVMVIHLWKWWRQGNIRWWDKALKALEMWEVFIEMGKECCWTEHTY